MIRADEYDSRDFSPEALRRSRIDVPSTELVTLPELAVGAGATGVAARIGWPLKTSVAAAHVSPLWLGSYQGRYSA
jgi:hypothetical protein